MAEVNMDFNRVPEKDILEKTKAEPEKHLNSVVTGEVKTKRRSLFKRFTDTFFKENIKDVKTYVIQDVVIPAICEGITDAITSAAGMLFLGEATRRTRRPGPTNNGSKISYDKMYNGRSERMPSSARSKVAYDFDDIWFESRGDAEIVLENMYDILNSEYRQVTVADLYDLLGKSTTFTQNKYGWRDLRGARVAGSPSRGYFLDLPRPMALD